MCLAQGPQRNDRPAITIAVDLGRKATKQTNKQNNSVIMVLVLYQSALYQGSSVYQTKANKYWVLFLMVL